MGQRALSARGEASPTTMNTTMNPADYEDERTQQLRLEARQTPAGQLLARMGMDYWDTESCARRVAEHAADELTAALAKVAELVTAKHDLIEALTNLHNYTRTNCSKYRNALDEEADTRYHEVHNLLARLTTTLPVVATPPPRLAATRPLDSRNNLRD